MNPRALSAEVIDNYRLLITFTNQEQRIFDVSEYLDLPVFQALQHPAYFCCVRIERGILSWPNEADFCPDTVYLKSVAI